MQQLQVQIPASACWHADAMNLGHVESTREWWRANISAQRHVSTPLQAPHAEPIVSLSLSPPGLRLRKNWKHNTDLDVKIPIQKGVSDSGSCSSVHSQLQQKI